MKKVFLFFLSALFLLVLPMQASAAVTANYAVTQAFLNSLDEAGIHYSWLGLDNDNDENVRISYEGDYMGEIVTNWYFNNDPQRVSVRVWNIIAYSDKNYPDVLETLNSLNARFRYISLYADTSDSSVTAKYDTLVQPENCGPMCVDALKSIVNIVDIAYNALQQYNTAR